jgi:hypothetical protein
MFTVGQEVVTRRNRFNSDSTFKDSRLVLATVEEVREVNFPNGRPETTLYVLRYAEDGGVAWRYEKFNEIMDAAAYRAKHGAPEA